MQSTQLSRGLYGVKLVGCDDCLSMGVVPKTWPEWGVTIGHREGVDSGPPESVGADAAFIRFGDGSTAEVKKTPPGAHVKMTLARGVAPTEIAHPYLAVVGMLSAFWGERIPLHAGAAGIDGKAWLVAAAKTGGKSTTMAMLDLAGYPVLADDLSVIDPPLNVHRGPRFIDLREETARALGVGEYVGILGERERWRYRIGEAPLWLPLGGIVFPSWGESTTIEPLSGSSRLELLAPSLALRVPGRWSELFLNVALSVPVLRWSRPPDLPNAQDALAGLLQAIRSVSD